MTETGLVGDSILSRAAYGGGLGYGQGYGRDFASDATNAIRINSSERLATSQHGSLSQQISDNADRNRDLSVQGNSAVSFANLADKLNDQNRFFGAEVNSLQREIAANAREAAKCCCEAKLLAVEGIAKTEAVQALVIANQTADARVAAAVADATQNAKLDALLADNGGGHRGN